jgi:hypothetical protein
VDELEMRRNGVFGFDGDRADHICSGKIWSVVTEFIPLSFHRPCQLASSPVVALREHGVVNLCRDEGG